ncbi:hypothetical protein B0J11DRAFT_300221 [Dendryphion nanum]|uniref:AHC1-like C2H2 zinc-finger domain-containing protein n=1 Tax=Dendryphion nanum TaxID=256645 RepID=A0A9P9IN69_9PLEO|nr:hypothetical protein B0J11DRAFT_300221 [Dendryphion nanum]
MQSMFRLPWSSDSPGDKIMEKATLHKSRPMQVVDVPAFMKQLKRKPTASPEPASPQHAHVVKKWKGPQGEVKPTASSMIGSQDHVLVVDGVHVATSTESSLKPVEPEATPKTASAEGLESRPKAQSVKKEPASKPKLSKVQKPVVKPAPTSDNNPTPTMDSDLNSAQQAIEAQFNYEILLKHQELRLIEQELAKCTVSLEQLRRCALIPFPGTDGVSLDVSGGVGPSLQPSAGMTHPQYAAPWGVTDGPYTRHYAKWLIPDPKFDSMSERELAQQSQGYFGMGGGRTTRGSYADMGTTSKARTSRTSTGTLKLPALGETPAPAPKIDPLLHKRSTDGQWVRLYCAQCAHSNFSNTQGFLNHCRIKHNQVFKSHDQAAIACGIPVDTNEVGTPVTAAEPPTAVPTPAATVPTPMTSGAVHPLIRSNPSEMAKNVYRDYSKPKEQAKPTPPVPNPAFTSASSTPYMNALLQKHDFGGDFKQMVDTARAKVDLDSMELSDDDSATHTPITARPQPLARQPVSAPNAASASKLPSARPGSKKVHLSGHTRLPHLPPPVHVGGDHHMPHSPVDLSPNTVESNPGLVSDHDDDDDDEDADDATSQPDIIMNDDVLVEDSSDIESVDAERTGSRKGLEGCFEKGEGSRKH